MRGRIKMITNKDIEYVAGLAKLKLSDEEKERLTSQMDGIVEFANKISELNTDNVEPTNHILKVQNVMREDAVKPSYDRNEIIKNAPVKEAGCIIVPSVQ